MSHDETGLVLMGQSTDNIEVVGSVGVTVLGEAGNDTLTGGAGNDTIDGGEGDDTLTGGLGDDVIIASEGYDQIDGGAGTDTISFANDAIDAALNQLITTNQFSNEVGVYVDLEQGTYDGPVDTTSSNGTNSPGQLAGVENVGGSLFSDQIFGSDDNNLLFGNVGNDELYGGLGNDLLSGGTGNDILRGGDGDDTFIISVGNDTTIEVAATDLSDYQNAVNALNHAVSQLNAAQVAKSLADSNYVYAQQNYQSLISSGVIISADQSMFEAEPNDSFESATFVPRAALQVVQIQMLRTTVFLGLPLVHFA